MRINTKKGSAIWALHMEEQGKTIVSYSECWKLGYHHKADAYAVVEETEFYDGLRHLAKNEGTVMLNSEGKYLSFVDRTMKQSSDCYSWQSCTIILSDDPVTNYILPEDPNE